MGSTDTAAPRPRSGSVLTEPGRAGFDIALAGIDGIGKSTVARSLATALRERGYPVTVTSWRGYLEAEAEPGQPADGQVGLVDPLSTLYQAQVRLFFAGCLGPDGAPADTLLPAPGRALLGRGRRLPIDDPPVRMSLNTDRPAAFLAAGLCEVAARLAERELVVDPAIARGEVVIHENHGLRNSVKFGLFAGHLRASALVEEYLSFVHRCLREWAPPRMSVLVSGDPELAYAWRRRQNGFASRGEYLDEDGKPAERTFIDLQSRLQDRLARIADSDGWLRVTMTDRPCEHNVRAAVDSVLAGLHDLGLVAAGGGHD